MPSSRKCLDMKVLPTIFCQNSLGTLFRDLKIIRSFSSRAHRKKLKVMVTIEVNWKKTVEQE